MKYYLSAIVVALFCVSCSSSNRELARIPSPDGKFMAVVTVREIRGLPLPPEPPARKGCWAKLTITKKGRSVFSTGFEALNKYEHPEFATDVLWSPDSRKVAYRKVNDFRVIGVDGKCRSYDVIKGNALISLFRWLGNRDLLVVTKAIHDRLELYGHPITYRGFINTARNVRVLRVNLDTGVSERYTKPTAEPEEVEYPGMWGPTFLFHSVGFLMDEISPYSSRVAFSDGKNICIYDDSQGKLVAEKPVSGSIDGIWWLNDDTVIVEVGLLSSNVLQFATFNVASQELKDVTPVLLPHWNGMYDSSDWFRPAMESKRSQSESASTNSASRQH